MKNKFLVVLISACMLFGLLTACGENPTAVVAPTLAATIAPPTPTGIPATAVVTASEVTIVTIKDFASKNLTLTRNLEIYLPPDYAKDLNTRYKVLYANDGQDMFSLSMKPTLEKLYAAKAIEPIIVVGVFATSERLSEYGTAGTPNAQKMGSNATAYTTFLIQEVMPYINQDYRTLTGATNTAIMGSSLGGLAAFDIAWRHADLFGKIGVFSGSFWWRTDDSTPAKKQSSRIMHSVVRATEVKPALKMWFEAGTRDEADDRDNNGVIDAIQDTTELMDELAQKGFKPGTDMVYLEIKDGQHNPATWAKALPDFLKWAFT